MDALRRDIRSALAGLRRSPGFAITALLTLALGIGSTTAVFTIVEGVLLRPLPYAQPERLVRIWEEYPGGAAAAGNRWLSRATYAGWLEHTRTLDALGGYAVRDYQIATGADSTDTITVPGSQISAALLDTLGTAPALGRWISDQDDRPGAPRVAVISAGLWRERYGASPSAIGGRLTVDGDGYTIVGVAPASFEFPDATARFWMPYQIPRAAATPTGAIVFSAVARIKPGVTLAQVEAEGTTIARVAPKHRMTEFFFGKGGPVVVHARRFADDMTAPIRPAISVLVAAVALVLLIACANVANLLLSRGITRERELAIRAAVGASRARIVRQLLTESAVFAIAGGTLGLALAWWLIRLLPAIAPAGLPRVEHVQLDAVVVAFWAFATLMAAAAAGLAPALRGGRLDLADAFRSPDGSTGSGFRGAHARRLRDGLLIVEAAFAVILIVGASLLTRSFVRLMQVDNGYTADRVLIAGVSLPRGASDARQDQFIDAALTRLRAAPGVSAVGAGAMVPLMRMTAMTGFSVPASLADGKPTQGRARVYWITPGYAEALGLRLREGRFFSDRDARSGNLPTIVNQEFVRQHLSVPQVTGLTIPHLVQADGAATAEIVGVIGNVLKDGNDRQPQPELYFVHGSHGQRIAGQVNFVIRTSSGDPAALAADIRGLLKQVDREITIDTVAPLTATLAASMEAPRFAATVVGGFALVAMVLAAVGLYGVLSYSVSQRVRELGIRAALGAGRANLVSLVLREGLSVTLAGIVLGVMGAGAVTRLMQQLLFGVTPLDLVAFSVAPLLLIMAAVAACLGPAWRAASADPAMTLRGQTR